MKTKLLIFLFFYTFSNSFAQVPSQTEQTVLKSNKIIFYGYDFSELRIVDAKRIGQDLKSYLFKLTGFFQEHMPESKLERWIKKDTIIYNFNPTLLITKNIINENIATATASVIDKDSIQKMISSYSIPEKEGIGYVIVFECFNSYKKTVSAYSVFFDISSRNILLYDYLEKREGNGYNNMKDWSAAAFITIKKLTLMYSDRL